MRTDPIRTWTITPGEHCGADEIEGPRTDGSVRVADAAAVAAALGDLMALVHSQRLTPFQLCVEIDRLREAVSGE